MSLGRGETASSGLRKPSLAPAFSSSVRLDWHGRPCSRSRPARKKFGDLMHVATRTYREFEDPEEGIWRPIYSDGELVSYRLYKLRRITKSLSWRRRR